MHDGSQTGPASARPVLRYFRWAFIVTAIGLALGAALGWQTTGTFGGMAGILFICTVLAVLEISLSFDNAIVNANKLKTMQPKWQHRFLTWGIVIAVFGMRIVFPLLIVVIAAGIGPWQAVVLAASRPEEYARIMHEARLPIAAFGGTFLLMVGLGFFFDGEKDVHWVRWLERRMQKYATIRGIEVGFALAKVVYGEARLVRAQTDARRLNLAGGTAVSYVLEPLVPVRLVLMGKARGSCTLEVRIHCIDLETGSLLDVLLTQSVHLEGDSLQRAFDLPSTSQGRMRLELRLLGDPETRFEVTRLELSENSPVDRFPIIFISIDTLSARHLSVYGHERE
ncbi:MAG: DUF475 domain-containing protein, partial [Paracoccus sp. (in: a-proteobacteria)]